MSAGFLKTSKRYRDSLVTENKLSEIAERIGGFEKWTELKEDCKRHVIKNLDYKSRFNLGICSKVDYQLVNRVPIYVYSIQFIDRPESRRNETAYIQVDVEFEKNANQQINVVFEKHADGAMMKWSKFINKRLPNRIKQKSYLIGRSCYRDEALKFIEKWMAKCKCGLSKIVVEMDNYPFGTSCIKTLPNLKEANFVSNCEESIRTWLMKFPEQMNSIQITYQPESYCENRLSSEILAMPQIMKCTQFCSTTPIDLSVESFSQLKAKRFSFQSPHITESVVNQFIKNWVNGKCVPGFEQAIFLSNKRWNEWNSEQVTAGIQKRRWGGDFGMEHGEFWETLQGLLTIRECYQVCSKVIQCESITLVFSIRTVEIYATGKQKWLNGQPYTSYSLP